MPDVEHKLAAILSADVAGYSRLMSQDEAATFRTLTAYREQIAAMKKRLFDRIEAGGGLSIPLRRPQGQRLDQRKNRR